MSKDELQQIAEPFFEKFSKDKLYVTTDGQVFIDEQRAREHAKGAKFYTFEKDGTIEEDVYTDPEASAPISEDLEKDANPLTALDPLNRGNEPTKDKGSNEE